MSTLKVNNIQNANGTSAIAIDSSGVATFSKTLVPSSSMMYRNIIINGDMRIDQRNAGASVTPANNEHCLDRYRNIITQSSKYSVQQVSDAPSGFTNSLKVTSLSSYSITSGDIFAISQRIEGYNIAHLDWGTANAKTVTLSFWVKSSLTGTFGGAFRNEVPDRDYPFSYTINVADTWEQKSITISGDTTGTWLSNNGIGIRLSFGFGVGATYSGTAGVWASSNIVSSTGATSVVGTSGATWQITGVQLEVGDAATPFEHRPYDAELARCQRYFQKIDGSNAVDGQFYSSTVARFHMQLSPTMRSTPTGSWSGTLTASIEEVGVAFRDPTGYSVNSGSNHSYTFNGTGISGATASKQAMFRGNIMALSLSAEL